MSIQPLSSSPSAADGAAARRRIADRDADTARESFALPPDEPVSDTRTASRDTRRDSAPAADQAARDAPETPPASDDRSARTQTATESRAENAAADESTGAEEVAKPASGRSPLAEPGKPRAVPSEVLPSGGPTAPKLDIAALVSIAAAAEGESQAQPAAPVDPSLVAGEMLPMPTGKPKAATAPEGGEEAKAGEGATATSPETAVPMPVPVLAALAPAPATPEPPAAAANGATTIGEGRNQTTQADAAALAVQTAALAAASATAGGLTVQSGAEAAEPGTPGQGIERLPMRPGTAGQPHLSLVAAETGDAPKGEALPQAQAEGLDKLAKAEGGAASQPVAAAESKPAERFEQLLNAIDSSVQPQQGAARPDPLRLMTMPDPIIAPPSHPQGQAAAEGPPTPLHVLPIEIGLKALAGARQFDIRLDPGELGRVDVTLSISDTGEVSAKMVVDRVETLHLLQRDARTLERAFEQAGLKPSDAGVDISLRDPSDQSGFRHPRQQDEAPQRSRGSGSQADSAEDTPIVTSSAPLRRFVRLGGVDMSV
ncbi:flagellar hook-length control protein FliK [Bosea sp. (in: a-proteobacteria)]|uniref:flagellar hook-length control protein FliK n=1 Tax=Bosea sp. (in: a-proteobacteria) TaxID=1871050 RepID=UPI00273354A2|nr:flagellar hook-length control protein FliK [Bosea sp. (in: a-proteobacteria)]MDP3256419.1 flagellar hook-length control protein FliK [Bosea sp. (in: a-proteobacteria)]